ncbi:MAG TPA: hypothetical protein VLL98_06025 [Rickettsiales bacterium]|nr:hypothetical protein [Rickettsiales bacterium]
MSDTIELDLGGNPEKTRGFFGFGGIDAYYVNDRKHIEKEQLQEIYTIILNGKDKEKIQNDLNNSEIVKTLEKEKNGGIIGATFGKIVEGKTKIDLFAFNTSVKEYPTTIKITLNSGDVIMWDLPQQELYKLAGDKKEKIENIEGFEDSYKIILPREGNFLTLNIKNDKEPPLIPGNPIEFGNHTPSVPHCR